jgi:hypothetical protein
VAGAYAHAVVDDPLVKPAGWRRPWWPALRLALVLLWVVAAALSWWTAPRETGFEQARQDVAAGRVTAYQWGSEWDGGSNRLFATPQLASSSPLGPLFAWRTSDGRIHWADTDDFDEVTSTRPADRTYAGVGAQFIGDQLTGRRFEDRLIPLGRIVDGIGIVLAVTFLSVLLAGPAPVRGTKWFWWWVGVLVPYGMGIVFWLLRDRPWVITEERVARTPGADPRDRGWAGLAAGILASLLISLLVWGLSDLLGTRWVPRLDT